MSDSVLVELRQPGLVVAHDHLDRHQVVDRQLEQARLGDKRRYPGKVRSGECGCTDLAEPLDVEGAATADMLHATAHLRRAALRIRAAQVDIALFRGRQQCAALGAVRGHHELALGAVAQFDHGPEHLRNHVPGLA